MEFPALPYVASTTGERQTKLHPNVSAREMNSLNRSTFFSSISILCTPGCAPLLACEVKYSEDYVNPLPHQLLISHNVPGYKFPDGSLSMNLSCINGEWQTESIGLKAIPDCERNYSSLMLREHLIWRLTFAFSDLRSGLLERRQLLIVQRLPVHKRLQRRTMSVWNGALCNNQDELQRRILVFRH